MNLDKTIKDLTNRVDSVHPASTNGGISHDGIHYWKSKQIISIKDWNELCEKNSTYTDNYKTTLTSKKPLQYFPDDYNGSTSLLSVIDQLKEEAQNWHTDYYELLEYRKNPTLGKMKCSKCLLSGSNDDPIFVGIEKVFGRIVSNQCNNDNTNAKSNGFISYHCNVMNIFSCPFESKEEYRNNNREEIKLPYTKENLFALHQISFAIEQAITTFFEITKQNEIIYEVDFVNDRVKEIHTKYNGELESWGWNNNVKEQLSKVKPMSPISIRNEQDLYDILTNRGKLEELFQEYEKGNNHQCDKELDIEYLNSNLNTKEEIRKHKDEQLILVKENKQMIIDFLLDDRDSIRIEDLKIYEPIYKCYREKGNCHICNNLSNIICKNCNHNQRNYKEVWLCTNHWQEHLVKNH
jgi:hypothetical protein